LVKYNIARKKRGADKITAANKKIYDAEQARIRAIMAANFLERLKNEKRDRMNEKCQTISV